jgi:Glycosyl hydrolase family 79, N-terminal domain
MFGVGAAMSFRRIQLMLRAFNRIRTHLQALAGAGVLLAVPCHFAAAGGVMLVPAELPAVATIDQRFQSFNIEMVAVTGGPFWKPYAAEDDLAQSRETTRSAPVSRSDLFSSRQPIDLANPRLRKLASALSPAYLRVSGTWANSTFFAGSDGMPPRPPAGYKGVLTTHRWRDVIDFSKAVNAPIVTSFAISPGTRDSKGVWKPDSARRMIAATRAAGGQMAAAEFMNEPDLPAIGGAPAGYNAAAYARDFAAFHDFMKRTAPHVMILGPGTMGRGSLAAELFRTSASAIDAASYHFYGDLSERCTPTHSADAALSEEWLSRTEQTFDFYRGLRDEVAPGKPIWLTETAEAACGGNRWSSTFLDTFRYLDQLGRLARAGVQIVMHNTLVGSDYGLLDEVTFLPRPNYWAALLWRKFMGSVVLDSRIPIQQGLHVYAHCQRQNPGDVVLLVINNDPRDSRELVLPNASSRFTLDAATLQDGAVRMNGTVLAEGALDRFPEQAGIPTDPGLVRFAPATITFLVISGANNDNCR